MEFIEVCVKLGKFFKEFFFLEDYGMFLFTKCF